MSLCLFVSLIGLFDLVTVRATSSYQALETIKRFADSFVGSPDVIAARDVFAEDVQGNIEILSRIQGIDQAVEYLYGPFASNESHRNGPALFEAPTGYNVTKLVIEHTTVSAALLFEVPIHILNQTLPVEIQGYFKVDEEQKIARFDLGFPHWTSAADSIVSALVPQLSIGLNLPANSSSNATAVLQTYLASTACNATMSACTGDNQVYDTVEECVSFMGGIPFGHYDRLSENSAACRAFHSALLPLRPAEHCQNVGRTGGQMCVDSDETSTYPQRLPPDTVQAGSFDKDFIGPLVLTPANAYLLSEVSLTSDQPHNPLLEITLNTQGLHSWDPTLFATFTFVLLLYFYFFAMGMDMLFLQFHRLYRTIPREHQKNVIIYTMNIIFTTIALALQLVPVPGFASRYRLWEVQCLRFASALVSSLYIFEMIFRFGTMRLPLIAHHVLTVFAISLTLTLFEYNQSLTYMLSAVIWFLQATTEQPTFVGLMGYRLKWSPRLVANLLKCAAIQTLIFKMGSAIALIAYWGVHQTYTDQPIDLAWSAFVWIISIGLLLTQLWGSYLTYLIGVRVDLKNRLPSGSQQASESDLGIARREMKNDARRLSMPLRGMYTLARGRGDDKEARSSTFDLQQDRNSV